VKLERFEHETRPQAKKVVFLLVSSTTNRMGIPEHGQPEKKQKIVEKTDFKLRQIFKQWHNAIFEVPLSNAMLCLLFA
jgi:hypothetical protein